MTKYFEPWEDESGNEYPIERLREECKKWDANTWERYSQRLEGQQTEVLTGNYDKILLRHDVRDAMESFYSEIPSQIHVSPEALHEAVGKLPGQQQRLLTLHIWEGKSFSDIAQDLEISRSAVWRLYRRALKSLRIELGRFG